MTLTVTATISEGLSDIFCTVIANILTDCVVDRHLISDTDDWTALGDVNRENIVNYFVRLVPSRSNDTPVANVRMVASRI